jgi:pimeloyl-ACP methyl ester carboxylesterase
MPTVSLDAGTIHYENTGPVGGRPVVFIHGYGMASSLWRPLTERLAARGLRCIAPTWPLGGHPEPMNAGADLTMEGIAAMVAELHERLELRDVVLVGNDTGGAIAQIVAGRHAERVGALVLTSCDAFEHFPPPILKPFMVASRSAALFRIAVMPMRTKFGRQRGYGALAHADIEPLVKEWTTPMFRTPGIAEDLRRFTGSLHQQTTLDAAAGLGSFDGPALVAWSADDVFFPVEDGRRLAAALPAGRLEIIDGARTFSMIDRPDALAELIGAFATEAPAPASGRTATAGL